MDITDIQAIIPVGFNTGLGLGNAPNELFLVDGISLLCRALGEVAGAGISKALLVVSYADALPRWLSPAVQECQVELETLGLPVLKIETLYLNRCDRLDDGVAFAMSCVTTPWAAVICPLVHLPDLTGLSLVLEAAQTSDRAAIGVSDADWETAIQLCALTLSENHLAHSVEAYCPQDDQPIVYAGRAILPATSFPTEGFGDAWISENEALLNHFIAVLGPLDTYRLSGPVDDFRFHLGRPEAKATPEFSTQLMSRKNPGANRSTSRMTTRLTKSAV